MFFGGLIMVRHIVMIAKCRCSIVYIHTNSHIERVAISSRHCLLILFSILTSKCSFSDL